MDGFIVGQYLEIDDIIEHIDTILETQREDKAQALRELAALREMCEEGAKLAQLRIIELLRG